MNILNNVKSVFLSQLKFDFKKRPTSDENHQFKMGVASRIGTLRKIGDNYELNATLSIIVGNDVVTEMKNQIDNDDFFKGRSYFIADYKIMFDTIADNLVLKEDEASELNPELIEDVFTVLQPYFFELMNSTFSRSDFPAPPLDTYFWRRG